MYGDRSSGMFYDCLVNCGDIVLDLLYYNDKEEKMNEQLVVNFIVGNSFFWLFNLIYVGISSVYAANC